MPNQFDRVFLSDEWHSWKWTHARKEHEDWFGDRNEPGEHYVKRPYGQARHEDIKLSPRSLDKMLFAMFGANPVFRGVAERIKEDRDREHERKMRETLESLARFTSLPDNENNKP